MSQLHDFCRYGLIDAVKNNIVDHGFDRTDEDEDGKTVFDIAFENKDPELAAVLLYSLMRCVLDHGERVAAISEVIDSDGEDETKIANLAFLRDAYVNSQYNDELDCEDLFKGALTDTYHDLHDACKAGDVNAVKLFLELDDGLFDHAKKDTDDKTVFDIAFENKDPELAAVLLYSLMRCVLDHGERVAAISEVIDSDGEDETKIANLAFLRDAYVNLQYNDKLDCKDLFKDVLTDTYHDLHDACKAGDVNAVKLFLDLDDDLFDGEVQDIEGKTVFDIVFESRNREIAAVLFYNLIKSQAIDDGYQALSEVIDSGDTDQVKRNNLVFLRDSYNASEYQAQHDCNYLFDDLMAELNQAIHQAPNLTPNPSPAASGASSASYQSAFSR